MKWQTKLRYYQQHIRGFYNPGDFDLPVGLEQTLCRNEALRTGNRQLYHHFLLEHGVAAIQEELEAFDETASHLLFMEQHHIQYLMRSCGVNILQSDIWIDDEDCIFKLLDVAEEEVLLRLDQTLRAVVAVNILPQEMAGNACAWVDISAFKTKIAAEVLARYATKLAS